VFCSQDDHSNWIEYLDYARQTFRGARFKGEALDSCIFISPINEAQLAQTWLISLFSKEFLEDSERRALLTGRPAKALPETGKIICACFNVGVKTIQTAIYAQQLRTTQEIGQCLKAGTNCGSCLPELKQLLP